MQLQMPVLQQPSYQLGSICITAVLCHQEQTYKRKDQLLKPARSTQHNHKGSASTSYKDVSPPKAPALLYMHLQCRTGRPQVAGTAGQR